MQVNNINIVNRDKKFIYYFEYYNDLISYLNSFLSYNISNNSITFNNSNYNNLYCQKNYWVDSIETANTAYLPDFINISSINVFFPNYSVETYEKNVKYALDIKIWIDNIKINLGSFLIDRLNTVACEKPRIFLNQTYYENYNIIIPDPYFIVYSDEWKKWRLYNIYKPIELNTLAGTELEEFIYNYKETNDSSSNILIQFHPVEYIENKYIKTTNYQGGLNTIAFNTSSNQYLNLKLSHNFNISNTNPEIIAKLNFNNIYENNLLEYLNETYNLSDYFIQLEVVVKDKNNIYKYIEKSGKECNYNISVKEFGFKDWSDYIEGMKFYAILTIYNSEEDKLNKELHCIQISSNEIFITKEVFKFLINKSNIYNINLNTIDMLNYKCNIVNKIQKNIVKIDRPSDYKSNIIKPVFFRTQELSKLLLHSSVTENIALNLDEYKNKVDIFYLNVNGTLFQEIGRTNQGVIFKIIGQKIDKSVKFGNYYILNQDQEMVTFGEYQII